MPDQPNILLIVTDQQHWQMMSCAGNEYVSTPAMDTLAQEGVRFNRAYCGNPVCVPSRFTMFTGRLPSVIGMRGNIPPGGDDDPLPAFIEKNGAGHLLSAAGYRCLYAGKQHFPRTDARRLGFELITEDERDECAQRSAEIVSQNQDQPLFLVTSLINPHDICYMAIRDFKHTYDFAQVLLDRGEVECAELDRALQLPDGVSESEFYDQRCPPLPPNFEVQEDEPSAIDDLLSQRPFKVAAREQWSDQRWRLHRWAYARLTERVDGQIHRVLQALDEGPNASNTLVLFTSDHGDNDSSHHLEHKTQFYDEAARVPLIVRQPDQMRAGTVDDEHIVSTGLDLIPTLCDYAGTRPPDDLEGQSFRALVEAEETTADHSWTKIENEIGRAIVSHDYKYMVYDSGTSAEQLFDLTNDPHETRNALHDAEHQSVLPVLRQHYAQAFGQ